MKHLPTWEPLIEECIDETERAVCMCVGACVRVCVCVRPHVAFWCLCVVTQCNLRTVGERE